MDEYTDKTYQGSGFSGQRMGGTTQAPPPAPSPMEPPAQPLTPPPPASEVTSTAARGQSIWDEPYPPDQGQMKGLMVQGFLLGFFLGLIGLAGIAFFSDTIKRGDRLMGGVIGIAVNIICTIALIAATA